MTDSSPDNGWLEPESSANEDTGPQYPYNKVIQTESGHLVELDDTPNRERIRVAHRSGTFIEMHPNGDHVHKVYGDGFEITVGNKNILVEGVCSVTINGDAILEVRGNRIEKVAGDYRLQVDGEFVAYSRTKASLLSDQDVLIGAGSGELGGGDLYLSSSNKVYSTDFICGGEIIGDILTSLTRIDAGTGVFAGPLGFVTVLGGLSVGTPIAIPGMINCIGMINAAIAVNTDLVNCFISNAVLMTDTVNTTLHNIHGHIAPFGPTSPPFPDML